MLKSGQWRLNTVTKIFSTMTNIISQNLEVENRIKHGQIKSIDIKYSQQNILNHNQI